MQDPLSVGLTITLALLVAVGLLALTARYPQQALLAAIPVLLWPQPLAVSGIPVQQAVTAVLVCGVLAGARHQLRTLTTPAVLLAGFVALATVSQIVGGQPGELTSAQAHNELATLCLNLGLALTVTAAQLDVVTVLKTFALSGAAMAMWLYLHGEQIQGRLTLDGLNPNSGGHAAAIAVVAAIAVTAATKQLRWLPLAAPPLAVVAASQSRGALVVLAVGLTVVPIARLHGKARTFTAIAAAGTALILWTPINNLISTEILTARNSKFLSTDARADVLDLAANLTATHPLWGVGYGRFLDYSARTLGVALNTHNDWSRIAAECGIPALLLLAALFAVPLLRRETHSGRWTILPVLIAAATSFAFANTMTDLRVSLPVWVLLGVAWNKPADNDCRGATIRASRPLPVARRASSLRSDLSLRPCR